MGNETFLEIRSLINNSNLLVVNKNTQPGLYKKTMKELVSKLETYGIDSEVAQAGLDAINDSYRNTVALAAPDQQGWSNAMFVRSLQESMLLMNNIIGEMTETISKSRVV